MTHSDIERATEHETSDLRLEACVADFFQTHWPELADGWEKLDLDGRTVIPGYVSDNHDHAWRNTTFTSDRIKQHRQAFIRGLRRARKDAFGMMYYLMLPFMDSPLDVYERHAASMRPYDTFAMRDELNQHLASRFPSYRVVWSAHHSPTGTYMVIRQHPDR